MIQFYSPPKLVKRLAFLFLLIVGINQLSRAQAPTISYPTAAQNLSRGIGDSLLTVKLVFNGVCSGTVRLGLPASVTYVPGTVTKTSGTASVSIAESSIADLSKPTFSISGVAAIGDEITFTVARRAGCGSLATAKDSVYFVAGAGCSDGNEIAGTVNTYNIFAPTLPITPAAALTGAVIGTTASRTTVVTNGGKGPTDTVRFYVVYPSAGIVNSSGTNAVTANGVSFTPSSINGDTLFYKFAGATLFGGNNLLTSGETVTVVEPIRVAKCNSITTYGARWGRSDAALCEKSTATSSVSMATGIPNFTTATGARIGYVDKCTPFDYTLVMTNGGSGNVVAAAMYDLKIAQGSHGGTAGGLNDFDTTTFSLSNSMIGTASVPSSRVTWVGGIQHVNVVDLFTTDPDGAGVGLDDIDGDTYFDDLAGGKSVTLLTTMTFKCDQPCSKDLILHSEVGVRLTYHTMCDATTIVSDKRPSGLNQIYEASFDGVAYVPANIIGGTPFRFQAKAAYYLNVSSFDGPNTRYRWKIALPAGFSVSGTGSPTYGGTSVSHTIISGGGSGVDTVVYTSSVNNLDSFNINLVYSCGTGGTKSIYYALEKINNIVTGCECQSKKFCDAISTYAFCPTPCPGGPGNYIPQVRRASGSIGWTDYTLATRQVASAISAYDLSKALYLDTINVFCSALQGNAASNLHLELTLPKTTSGVNKLTPIQVISSYYRGGSLLTTSTVTTASGAASTASEQAIDWTLTIPGGALLASDSIFSIATYVVATNELPTNDIQSGSRNIYYNINGLGIREYCTEPVPEMYLVGTTPTNAHNGYSTNGCNPNTLGGSTNYLARRFDASGLNYQNEFRPVLYVDSVVATIPTGYQFVQADYQPITGGSAISALTPTSITGNVYRFVNPGTWPVLGLTVYNTYGGYIPFTVVPTCATVNNEPINFKVYVRDYYYAYAGSPTPTGFAYELSDPVGGGGKTLGIAYSTTDKPDIVLANQTGTVQGVQTNQSWTMRMSSVGLTTAPYTWIAIPTAANINVTSVTDIATATVLTPISYSGGRWYQISATGLPSGTFKDYKIDFTYTACSLDSIKVFGGWNCASYPADPTAYVCGSDSLFLKVSPEPSQVQLSVLRQPGGGSSINLCTTDSALLVLNSAQAANLVNPYITFFPPAGLTLVTPIQVEYPRGSGNYQNATTTSLPGGGYQINLNAHTGIGTNGMLGTALANPAYVPLGGDREAKIKMNFTTDCSFTSGTSFTFNAYGSRPCGAPAIDNGIAATTSKLDITGASAAGGAGVTISFGGAATTLGCGSTVVTLSLITTPTSLGTTAGDTMTYTLPVGMGYAGNLTSGYSATVTGGAGAPTIVKVAMPTGVAAGTAISFNFDVVPQGGGCGSVNIMGAYQRRIASLFCGATACASSSVVISTATSPNITLVKPSLVISNLNILDTTAWRQAAYPANHIRVFYSNNGTQAYTANTDTIEFFCNAAATVPFAKMPLTKALAIGASDSDEYYLMMPMGSCSPGDVIVSRIQTQTAAGTPQCLCSPSSFVSAGIGLPLTFTNTSINAQNCAVNIGWAYSESGSDKVASFIIERSSNGAQYSPVASVSAISSNYVDVTPSSGKWYYRIKATGLDGKTAYSNTLIATTSQCVGNSVKVYPNPASNLLQIVLQGASNSNAYELVDALGRTIVKGSLNSNSNNNVDVSGVLRGSYIIKVITDDNVTTHQVQIVK